MRKYLFPAAVSLFIVSVPIAGAATLYKWVDEDGNIVYQDTPPPNNIQFEETQVEAEPEPLSDQVGQQIEEAAQANPVTLYSVPVCDSCDLVRLYLERNAIPFAEKNVRNNPDTQAELEGLTGALSVPTLAIGSTTLDGFSRTAIKSALSDAGFPMDGQQSAATQTNTSTTEDTTAATATEESESQENAIEPLEDLAQDDGVTEEDDIFSELDQDEFEEDIDDEPGTAEIEFSNSDSGG